VRNVVLLARHGVPDDMVGIPHAGRGATQNVVVAGSLVR
jgi:hypothetical protein